MHRLFILILEATHLKRSARQSDKGHIRGKLLLQLVRQGLPQPRPVLGTGDLRAVWGHLLQNCLQCIGLLPGGRQGRTQLLRGGIMVY